MVDDMIFLGSTDIKGPNIEIEARLVRFYVVVCNQYIVPMIGKICHISSDESKQVCLLFRHNWIDAATVNMWYCHLQIPMTTAEI